jgi:hypothetical protein
MLSAAPKAAEALRELLMIKIDWPFRPADQNTACHYFFKDNLYPRPKIDYLRLGCPPSPLDIILTRMGSAFENQDQLRCAEQLIEQKIKAVIRALDRPHEVRCDC